MAATPGRSDPAYDLLGAADDVAAAFTEYRVAHNRYVAAAKKYVTASDGLAAAARTYTAAYADLRTSIVRLEGGIGRAADVPDASPVHMQAMYDAALGFYNAALRAHETVVTASNAVGEAAAACRAKNAAFRARAAVVDSRRDTAAGKLAVFKAKFEAGRVPPEREAASIRALVTTIDKYWSEIGPKNAVAEHAAAARVVREVVKACADLAATHDTLKDDIDAAAGRMRDVFGKRAANVKADFAQGPPGG